MVCNLTAVTLVKSLEATDCRTQNSMLSNCQLTDWRSRQDNSKRSTQHPHRLLAGWCEPSPVLPVLVACPPLCARRWKCILNYVVASAIVLITGHLWNTTKMWKFHGKGQILQLGSKFCSPCKTVGPTDKSATASSETSQNYAHHRNDLSNTQC